MEKCKLSKGLILLDGKRSSMKSVSLTRTVIGASVSQTVKNSFHNGFDMAKSFFGLTDSVIRCYPTIWSEFSSRFLSHPDLELNSFDDIFYGGNDGKEETKES